MDKVEGLYDELMQSFADPYVNDLTLRAATEIARLEEALSPPSPDAEALAGRLEEAVKNRATGDWTARVPTKDLLEAAALIRGGGR